MAIKVKHDGNVTSRIYASAAGGKGKRQSEDAIRLAQLQASASGRGGGTGGGAHASASAPTTHAPTGHAQLGSTGSLISPQMSPETRMRLADDALNNKLIADDFADTYRAAEQERQGDISLSNRLAELDKTAEIANQRELTSQGRRERAALVDEVVRAVKEGKYSKEELPKLIESFSEAEDRIRLADALREREPTMAERIKKNTDTNGIVWSPDGSKILYNPVEAQTAAEQKTREYELRKAELEAKRRDARETQKTKFITDLMKPVKIGKNESGEDIIRQLSYDEAEEEAKKAFPDLYQPIQPAQSVATPSISKILSDAAQGRSPTSPEDNGDTPLVLFGDEEDYGGTNLEDDHSRGLPPDMSRQGVSAPTAQPATPVSVGKPIVAKTVEDAKKKWGVKR